jgi:hypothetical protein
MQHKDAKPEMRWGNEAKAIHTQCIAKRVGF